MAKKSKASVKPLDRPLHETPGAKKMVKERRAEALKNFDKQKATDKAFFAVKDKSGPFASKAVAGRGREDVKKIGKGKQSSAKRGK